MSQATAEIEAEVLVPAVEGSETGTENEEVDNHEEEGDEEKEAE